MLAVIRDAANRRGIDDMTYLKRNWMWLLAVVLIGSAAAGTFVYKSKCRGVDACAAAEAESHERDRPSEPQ